VNPARAPQSEESCRWHRRKQWIQSILEAAGSAEQPRRPRCPRNTVSPAKKRAIVPSEDSADVTALLRDRRLIQQRGKLISSWISAQVTQFLDDCCCDALCPRGAPETATSKSPLTPDSCRWKPVTLTTAVDPDLVATDPNQVVSAISFPSLE
jgi:hypothetical protein